MEEVSPAESLAVVRVAGNLFLNRTTVLINAMPAPTGSIRPPHTRQSIRMLRDMADRHDNS